MFSFLNVKPWLPTASLPSQLPYRDGDQRHVQRGLWRRFHGLESAVLCFCGGYGLLVALLLLPGAWPPLVISLLFIIFAAVRLRWPSRSKLDWSADALIALGLLALIFSDSRTGAGAGPYLFVLILFAMTFPLFMEGSTTIFFVALLLALYFAFGRSATQASTVSSLLFVLRGVLVTGICILSSRFGWMLRQYEASAEHMRCDLDSGAYNEHGWLYFGQRALAKCMRANKPLTLAYLNMPPDWAQQIVEARGFKSPRSQQLRQLRVQALQEITYHLSEAISHSSLVGRDANGDFVLILPNLTTHEALHILEQRFGRPLQINFGPPSDEMFVMFNPCMVQASAHESLQDLHARAGDIWQRGVASGAV